MALDITEVQAGELITAARVNELIREVEKLDVRVTTLEKAGSTLGSVVIDGVSPQPVTVGNDVTIVGRNFEFTTGATRVKFNNQGTPHFQALSNDSVLVCEVPEIAGLVAPAKVMLSVSNARTTAVREIDIKPMEALQAGDADIVFVGVTPDPLVSASDADFEFTLQSDAALPATMTMTPTITDADGAALGWKTSILDATRGVLATRQITINPGETRGFYVHVEIPDVGAALPFDLRVDGAGGGLVSSSGTQSFVVGETANPDPAIANLTPSPSSVVNGSFAGSTLSVALGTFATISVEADFRVDETYIVSFVPGAGTENWTLQTLNPSMSNPRVTIAPGDLTGTPPSAKSMLKVRARPNSAGTGQGVLTVQRAVEGETRKRTYTFDLVVAS